MTSPNPTPLQPTLSDNDGDEPVLPLPVEPPPPPFDKEDTLTRIRTLEKFRTRAEDCAKRNRSIRNIQTTLNSQELTSDGEYRQSQDDISEQSSHTNSESRIIPYRMLNSFIAKEKPVYLQYLTTPTRVASFLDKQEPVRLTSNVEQFFSSCFLYNGAVNKFMRLVDVSQLHGYGFIEIVYDVNAPGHFKFEAHHFEDVIFPECEDLASCTVLYVRKRFFRSDIKALNIEQSIKDRLLTVSQAEDKHTYIDKVYRYTPQGYVVISYSEHLKEFINEPAWFYNGFEDSKHILNLFCLPYDQNDERSINAKKGRAFYDRDIQRCATVLMSSLSEKAFKSAAIFAGLEPTRASGMSSEVKALEVSLQPDKIYSQLISFFSPPEPTMALLNMVNMLETMHANSIGQTSFAANNRQDSRKTATELLAAQQMSTLMSAVSIAIFSHFMSQLIDYSWLIVQEGVLSSRLPIPNTVSQEDFQRDYIKKPAGDAEYVRRQEKIQQLLSTLPIVANTPYGQVMLTRLVELLFPDEKFSQKVDQQNAEIELIQSMSSVLKEFLKSPNATTGIPPEQLKAVQSIITNADAVVGNHAAQLGLSGQDTGVQSPAPQQAGPPPQPGGKPPMELAA